jgi:chromosome segregation ATPase
VDKAWKLVEQAKNNEEKARKIISDLKSEISHLSKIVDKGSGLNVGEDNSVTKMMAEKATLENELAQKIDFIAQLENQKLQFQERLAKMENDMLREKEEVEKLKQDNEKLRDDKQREERKNNYALEEKKNLQANVQEKDLAIETLRNQSDSLTKEVNTLREQLEKSEINFQNKNKEWQQADFEKKGYEYSLK